MHRDLVRTLSLSILIAASMTGVRCASSGPQSPVAGPDAANESPEQVEQSTEPSIDEQIAALDEQGAESLIAAVWPLAEDHPLANPRSLDAVEQILELDQVNLFPNAIQFVANQDGEAALALHGQIELAWGETYVLLIEILAGVQTKLEERAKELESRGVIVPLPEEEQAELDRHRYNIDQLRLRIAALKLLGAEHMTTGSTKAEELIASNPSSYLGYRLAADFYRIMRDWENFDAMLARLEETNPKSNGLLFLKGASTFQREKDLEKATGFYDQALANNPKFVRAHAHLLVMQGSLDKTHAELLRLEEKNPEHPFVLLAGQAIKDAYAEWDKKQLHF